MEIHNIRLTSAEISALWTTYIECSATNCYYKLSIFKKINRVFYQFFKPNWFVYHLLCHVGFIEKRFRCSFFTFPVRNYEVWKRRAKYYGSKDGWNNRHNQQIEKIYKNDTPQIHY